MEVDCRLAVYVIPESISTPGRLGSEQTARFCQAVPRGDIRLTCVSARCGWLPRAAISTSREWAAIGEVAPLLLAAGTPKAPHLRIHTINPNRLTALIPRLSSGIVRRPARCDRRVRSALRIHPITPATYRAGHPRGDRPRFARRTDRRPRRRVAFATP